MKNTRMATLIRTVEARYPGVRTVVEPWGDPDGDPDIRWWIDFLYVRRKDLGRLDRFALRVARDLYGEDPLPFCLGGYGAKASREILIRRRAQARRDSRRRRASNGSRRRRGRGARTAARPART